MHLRTHTHRAAGPAHTCTPSQRPGDVTAYPHTYAHTHTPTHITARDPDWRSTQTRQTHTRPRPHAPSESQRTRHTRGTQTHMCTHQHRSGEETRASRSRTGERRRRRGERGRTAAPVVLSSQRRRRRRAASPIASPLRPPVSHGGVVSRALRATASSGSTGDAPSLVAFARLPRSRVERPGRVRHTCGVMATRRRESSHKRKREGG